MPTWANTASHSPETDTPCHNAQLDREFSPIPVSKDRELSHLTNTENATHASQCRQEARPTHAAKRCSKRKRVALFLSKAFKSLRGALLNYVSPDRDGTTFLKNEQESKVIADILRNDPGPWHEYGRLDSDTEDDKYNAYYTTPRRRPGVGRFKACSDRFTTAHESSSAF